MPREGLAFVPRYDLLLIIALAIQFAMIRFGLETMDEFKAICLFHVVGFALEAFKTSGAIQSWAYPDFAYTKLLGVPLFAGFMYAAVGSYIIQAWRILDVRILHHPPTGWRHWWRWRSISTSSPITISVTIAGISRRWRSDSMRAPP